MVKYDDKKEDFKKHELFFFKLLWQWKKAYL